MKAGVPADGAWEAAARRGDWNTAWAINDATLAARDPATRDDPRLPYHLRWVWDGRPPDGRDVLVRCYHGLGDTLMAARFLPCLVARAARVRVEAQAPLVALLRAIPGVEIVPFVLDRPHPPSDCDVESMELSHALRTPPDAVPAAWLPRPAPLAPPLPPGATGLCWRGGDWDPRRAIPAADLAPLRARAAGRLWSLQPDAGGASFRNPEGCGWDALATARLLASLDHVLAIDSMIAHLAGALGIPALVMLHEAADWRWGDHPARTALHPGHRLFRQAVAGDWRPVVAAAARAID